MPRRKNHLQRASDMQLGEYLRNIGHEDTLPMSTPSPPEEERPSQRTRTRTREQLAPESPHRKRDPDPSDPPGPSNDEDFDMHNYSGPGGADHDAYEPPPRAPENSDSAAGEEDVQPEHHEIIDHDHDDTRPR